MPRSAHDIYQANLDAVSIAIMRGDMAVLLDHIALPCHLSMTDASVQIRTQSDLRDTVDGFRAHMKSVHAETYVRLCQSAEFVAGHGDRILGTHTTYVLRGAQNVVDPVSSRMTLASESGQWKCLAVHAADSVVTLPIVNLDMALQQRAEAQQAAATTGEESDV